MRSITTMQSSLFLGALLFPTSAKSSFPPAAFVNTKSNTFSTPNLVGNTGRFDGSSSTISNHYSPKQISMASGNDENYPSDRDPNTNENIEDLSWRVAKVRLEEANTKRFLKRKPVKLPYETSRRWIQANWAPKTKEEFYDLVANGNLRTPYISKRPEEYYGERGEWISWDHYLLGTMDNSTDCGDQGMLKWQ